MSGLRINQTKARRLNRHGKVERHSHSRHAKLSRRVSWLAAISSFQRPAMNMRHYSNITIFALAVADLRTQHELHPDSGPSVGSRQGTCL